MAESTRMGHHAALVCLDRSGASVSALCAIHCAATPLLSSLLPLIGLGLLADERAEMALITTSGLLAASSFWLGSQVHRSRLVAALLLAGFLLLASGRVAERGDCEATGMALAVVGGLGIASAHLLSLRRLLARPAQ